MGTAKYTVMKPKLTTKNKTKINQNQIVWKSVMVLFILFIIFLISGCSSSDSEGPVKGTLVVNSNTAISFPAPDDDTYNQLYSVSPTTNVVQVQSAVNGNTTTTKFNLSDLGLADKEVTLTFSKQ